MFSADKLYGTQPQTPVYGVATVTQAIGFDGDKVGVSAHLDLNNPLLWFAGFLAVTLGAAAVSGSVRLGRARASGSIGKA